MLTARFTGRQFRPGGSVSVNVTVKFFASYREVVGLRETTLSLEEGQTLGTLLNRLLEDHPKLAAHRDSMLLAVNQEFVAPEVRLHNGDEVAVLPPVGGGAEYCRVQSEPIDTSAVLPLVRDPRAGAVVLFLGTVRADPGVRALDYEAYEGMALKKLETLRAAAIEKFEVTEVAIVHRTGRLEVGETAVAVACSAPHRQEAFAACAWAMEELKQIVPIWKTEKEDA